MAPSWIKTLLRASAGLIALSFSTPLSGLPSRAVCRDAPGCNVAGTRALDSGQMAAAEAAFKAQVCFAWRGGETAEIVLAHNNLALLALRRGEPLEARLWAEVALKFDSKSPAALHNARLAKQRASRMSAAQGVTGSYWSRWGDPLGHELWVQELPGKRIRFELWATHSTGGACDHPDYTQGGASGRVALTGGVAVWETREWGEPCRLGFSFGPDELTVTQDGSFQDCGFGGNVHADGTYRRTSRQPPHFTPSAVAPGR
jgi:hypothetical protein